MTIDPRLAAFVAGLEPVAVDEEVWPSGHRVRMDLVGRVQGMLLRPRGEWRTITRSQRTPRQTIALPTERPGRTRGWDKATRGAPYFVGKSTCRPMNGASSPTFTMSGASALESSCGRTSLS